MSNFSYLYTVLPNTSMVAMVKYYHKVFIISSI